MDNETTHAVAVLGLPELAHALDLTGVQVVSGETFRSAATAVAAQIQRSPVPIVMADRHVPGTTPWVEKVLRATRGALVAIDLPAGASRIGGNAPGALRISAPVRVDEILTSIGLPALAGGAMLERDGTVTYPVRGPTDRPESREIASAFDTNEPGRALDRPSSGMNGAGDSISIAGPAVRPAPGTTAGDQKAGLLARPMTVEDATADQMLPTGLAIDGLVPHPALPPRQDAPLPEHALAELDPPPGPTGRRALVPRALPVTVLVITASAVLALLVLRSTAIVLFFGPPLLLALAGVGIIVRTVRHRP